MRHSGNGRGRVVRAFLLAPLAAPTAYAAAVIAAALVGDSMSSGAAPQFGRGGVDLVLGTFAVGAPIAYGAMLVAGVPAYFALRRLGALTRWTLWASAAAIGAVTALLMAPRLRGDLFSIPFPWWVGALLGLVSAEALWRLGRFDRAGS